MEIRDETPNSIRGPETLGLLKRKMKRRGRLALLLPLSVLLIAITICASPTSIRNEITAEVEQGTTSATVKTPGKPEPTVSITERPTTANQPDVTTKRTSSSSSTSSLSRPIKVFHDQLHDAEDNTKELINFKNNRLQEILKRDKKVPAEDLVKLTKPVINPGDALLQEINTLDESDSNKKIKEDIKLLKDTIKPRAKSYVIPPLEKSCNRLIDNQSFGPGIAHLLIENAGEIRLGPHALRDRDLEHIETITIVDTRVSQIDRTAFDGITYLFAVNLSRNGIIDIHPDTFENNTQLNLLTISGNPFWRDWSVTKDYLLNAPSVTEFDFSWNSMPRLPKSAFSKMPSLAYLNLKQNQLSDIDRAIFKSLSSMVEVDLSGNLLSDLPDDVFEGTDLQSLKLNDNFLISLASVKATSLDILDVSNNRIKVIAKSDLDNVPSLEQLIISGNGLKRIHQHAFSELDQLEHLDISNNKLTSFTEHHLKNSPRLEVLLMSDNPDLGSLPVFKINGLEYNTYSVYRFECANCGLVELKSGTFNAMPAIANLNLAGNKLTGLPKDLLSPLSSLRELDLSDNMIAFIPSDMLRGAVSMTKLNLAGNPLMTLQNPLNCDAEFDGAIQWLKSHGVIPTETVRYISNLVASETEQHEPTGESVTSWSDLAKLVCEDELDRPILRPVPQKPPARDDEPTDEAAAKISKSDLGDMKFIKTFPDHKNNPVEDVWLELDKNIEYDDYSNDQVSSGYRTWYNTAMWSVLTIGLVTLGVLLIIIQFARYMANRRGRGPVIRPPMIMRQGLVDNKNCGLVYKPLQEEIPTPQLPKKPSGYSRGPFHYKQIVPESS
ncbi:hypothetical protein G9C98_005803 [Cotesia typhae]|uniref:Uncharacterized protein n=1 Tax=Cotesia typhae TaxID=2053667 RepID=A0A8J5URD3_9HYME|nr:hypothetical protein G9C98_005803 [Cotesia typhae]